MMKVLVAAFACIAIAPVWAEDTPPGIEEIMKKANGKKAGLHSKLKEGLNAKSPEWDKLAKNAEEYKKLIEFLGKNNPPKGEKSSWTKMTDHYKENAGKVNDAVGKKDKAAAMKALGAIDKSCAECHKAHRES